MRLRRLAGEPGEVRIHHHGHELLERDRWLPAEVLARLRGVADQVIDFGRANQ